MLKIKASLEALVWTIKERTEWVLLSLAVLLTPIMIAPTYMGGENIRKGKWMLPILLLGIGALKPIYERLGGVIAFLFIYPLTLWVFYGCETHGVLDIICISLTVAFLYFWSLRTYWEEQTLLRLIAYTGFAQAVLCFAQYLWRVPFPYPVVDPDFIGAVHGMMGHPTVVGPYLIVCAGIAYYFEQTILTAFMLAAAYLCNSSMTYATFLVMAGVIMWYRGNKKVTVPLFCVLAIGLIIGWNLYPDSQFYSLSGRLSPWSHCWKYILEGSWYNVIGYGPGSWMGLYPNMGIADTRQWNQVHNDLLQNVFEYGYIGLPVMVYSLYRAIRATLSRESFVYALIFWPLLIDSLGSFPMRLMPHGALIVLGWFMLVNKTSKFMTAPNGNSRGHSFLHSHVP